MTVSVAMITYNHEKYIARAIESIISQNVHFQYEIVIGEDCSTDATRAVILDFHRRYPDRIRLLLRDHNVGAMRNFVDTIEACRGEYLALLEGDDYWISSDKLQRQVDFLDGHPECALCCGRAKVHYEVGAEKFGPRGDLFPSRPPGTYKIEDILEDNFIATCTAVVRRELIGRFPEWFYEVKLGDWPLFAMVALHGDIELMDEILAAYRIHSGGMWSSMASATRLKEIIRMLIYLDQELQFQHTSLLRNTIASSYFKLSFASRSTGSRTETMKYFLMYLCGGGWHRSQSLRAFPGLAAYLIFGARYKALSLNRSRTEK
ncbi:MAG TPA: glycosyltransferase [Acidobacteriaceae bacterium]